MLSWSLTVALATSIAKAADPSPIGAAVNQGVTEIFGNSFGRPGFNTTFDYIVVGGGNAGNTLAARLALDPAQYSVALLEAGTFYEISDGNRTQVPGYNWINTLDFPIGQVSTEVSIALNTTPQVGYADRRIYYLAAQTFGGGSAANYMGYHRPTVGSFDKWSKQVDDDYWTWDNVFPAYKKSVTFQPPDYTKINPANNISYDPSAFDSDGGPLHVSYGNYFGPSGPALATAMDRAGLKPIEGLNSGKLIGYSTMTAAVDTRTATRDSSESSFLQAGARGSQNLKIYPNALVERVTFNAEKKATGVDVKANLANVDLRYHLSANKEVILSAGVWHSPQILMVSGVGPSATLQKYGIDVVSDLPGVGQNEWDQPLVPLLYAVNTTTNTQLQAGNPQVVSTAISDYLNHQSGILAGVGAGLAVGYEKFPDKYRRQFKNSTLQHLSTFPSDWPEVEYVELENIPITLFKSLLGGTIGPKENYFNINGVLLATQSRGNMTINSADVSTQPSISPNWLANGDVDMDQAVAAFHRIRDIAGNCSAIAAEVFPGPTVNTSAAIKTFLRDNMNHLYHGSGTCKMGTASDTSSVVDSRARVHGVTGLRVVDASAFALLPPGHPMASVYMFAEKIAESILGGE